MRMESVVNNRKANVLVRVLEKLDDEEFSWLDNLDKPSKSKFRRKVK